GTAAEEGCRMSAYPQLADPNEYRTLLEHYGSKRAVARALGCAKSTVDEWGQKHGVEFTGTTEAREEGEAEALLPKLKTPRTVEELADEFDRSPSTIRAWLTQLQSDGYNIIETGGRYSLPKTAAPADAVVDHR